MVSIQTSTRTLVPDLDEAYCIKSACHLFKPVGGLLIYDVSDPVNPVYVACNGDDGYVHDAQCVIYTGPDADYQGNEVCLVSQPCCSNHMAQYRWHDLPTSQFYWLSVHDYQCMTSQ